MVLVVAGEFLYGEQKERVSLPGFYMDKYEVTVKRYASFLQVSGLKQPAYWNQASQAGAENRPVIGVDWFDADVYCRHYGKRLPTEQEWEKAARGTDGRTYPWGNEAPSSRYANMPGKVRSIPSLAIGTVGSKRLAVMKRVRALMGFMILRETCGCGRARITIQQIQY